MKVFFDYKETKEKYLYIGGIKMKEKNWFNKEPQEVETELQTNLKDGLTDGEAKQRIEEYGLNQLQSKKKKSLAQKFLEQFKDFSIIILIFFTTKLAFF